jgi:hypothetical protein
MKNDGWTSRERDLLNRLELAKEREGKAKAALTSSRSKERDLKDRLRAAGEALQG